MVRRDPRSRYTGIGSGNSLMNEPVPGFRRLKSARDARGSFLRTGTGLPCLRDCKKEGTKLYLPLGYICSPVVSGAPLLK